MKKHWRFIVLIIINCQLSIVNSKAQYPQNYFRSPLDIPLFLAGNFGEIRSNHFHAGLDLKTQGVEGKPVYAAADGFVSRIKIQAGGYGKALYITHPNGYTTLYGHLSAYGDTISGYVTSQQYRKETFEIELLPDSNLFRIKKGDIIAYSGNTGSSGGPHLHFEIRDTKSESPINPLFFGVNIKDNIPPAITSLAVYSFGKNPRKGFTGKTIYSVSKSEGKYIVNGGKPLIASGITGFGIEVYDQQDGAENHNGAYSIELLKDSTQIYFHKIDEMPFFLSRFINSHIDYEEKVLNKKTLQKSFLEPGNQLKIYKTDSEKGKSIIDYGKKYKFRYNVKDASGNTSTLSFTVDGAKSAAPAKADSLIAKTFYNDSVNTFSSKGIELQMSDYSLYNDIDFTYSTKPKTKYTYSVIHSIHKNTEPVQREYTLSIKPDTIPQKISSKLLMVSFNENGNPVSEGGELKGGMVTTKTKSFGDFSIMADTTAPKITPVNITIDGDLSAAKTIKVKITDNLSGIGFYRGTIDGKWILMEYDSKNSLLTYTFDKTLSKGKHYFEFTASDRKLNSAKYEASFYR